MQPEMPGNFREVGMPKHKFRGCAQLPARPRGKLEGRSGGRSDVMWGKNYKQVSVGGGKAESRNTREQSSARSACPLRFKRNFIISNSFLNCFALVLYYKLLYYANFDRMSYKIEEIKR